MELLKFPGKKGDINIPRQIGTKFKHFGIFLLNDRTGARITSIITKYRDDAEQINLEVLGEWLKGNGKKPVTWRTLVGVLCDCDLPILSEQIRSVKQ